MKISYNWLKEYINVDLSPNKVSELLTNTGLEVEGLEEIESIKGGLKGVVIGEVLSCEQHPNADKLKVTTVNIGGDEPLQIVCGAPNVAVGQKVPVATTGTVIYTDDGSFKIKKSKLRGEVSNGMICAEDELGLGTNHDGIMVLDKDAVVGTPAAEYFNIESDHVIEIGLTPNRTDAISHYGVARDLRAAMLRFGHQGVELNLPSIWSFKVDSQDLKVAVEIEDTEACYRYCGLSIKNVKVEPSPEWLQNRLKAIGINPTNNVVDVTNYVMHETGHPLHAFDLEEISGHKVVVKKAKQGAKFTTLDELERELHADDLMICNDKEAMVLAGVYGGIRSGVSEKTDKIFLESAHFNPVTIRKAAKRHGLNTDSSFRYERGVDPEMTEYALKRAAILIKELTGGEISMNLVDVHPVKVEAHDVTVSFERMNQLIGQEIDRETVRRILSWLEIKIVAETEKTLQLQVPAYRSDVTREADIVEEVLRIYGFNSVELGEKMSISIAELDARGEAAYREKLSAILSGSGFMEMINNSLTKASYYENYGFSSANSVKMLNPLSQDLGVMRQDLIFGGLEVISYNQKRQRPNVKLYEFGRHYSLSGEEYKEQERLGLWIAGQEEAETWKNPSRKSDFFTLKHNVLKVLTALGFKNFEEEEIESPLFAEALNLSIHRKNLVVLGRVSAKLNKDFEVKGDVYYANFNWQELTALAARQKIVFKDLPRFPETRRDLALLVDENIKYGDLKKAALKADRKLIRSVNLFDVYEGKNLPKGKKSYAISLVLRDDEKTLQDKQVDKVMEKVLASFKKQFAAELR